MGEKIDDFWDFDESEKPFRKPVIENNFYLDRRSFIKIISISTIGALMSIPISAGDSEKKFLDQLKRDYEQCALEEAEKQKQIRLELEETQKIISIKNRNKRIEDVISKAWYEIPEGRKYFEMIADSNTKYCNIFDVPIEYHIALVRQESAYLSRVHSFAGALGLGQLMRYTAEGLGMKVFDKKKFPKAFELEDTLRKEYKKSNILYSEISNMSNNLFRSEMSHSELLNQINLIKKFKHERAQTWNILNAVYEEARYAYKNITEDDDDRLNPKIALDFSAKHLAENCLKMQNHFGGRKIHNILRGLAAYNSDVERTIKNLGLPFIPETTNYVRRIMVYSDKIYPGYD
ncbi:MAG TPA: lytic transglycosylase domain-containing protein [Allocoleopsis sp.]